MDASFLIQLVVNGLVIGVIYALIAMGLSLIFGVLEIVNFAHGEFYMLGADGGLLSHRQFRLRLLAHNRRCDAGQPVRGLRALRSAAGVLAGGGFERSILLTLGLSMVLQNGAVYLFTATPKMLQTAYTYSNLIVGDVQVPVLRIFALGLGLAAFAALYLILYRTQVGKAMRGVAQNREAALMVGIDPRAISRLAVVIGIGLSGLAGAALAPVYAVHPLMGFSFVFKAFAIIIIGGLGNVRGAAVAAIALGVLENLMGGFLPQVMVDGLVFAAMILILLIRPQGLFGRGVRV